mgnify:CR=1 FL=1
MSTLRINNIEAQSVPASPTIDEKVKVTNSSGDILVNIDGKTSGITTIGINTTDGNIKFDANSNVLITGILTATTLAGNFTPDSLEIGSNIKLGNAGVITATSFVGSGANLTGIDATKIITGNTQVQTIDTGSDGHVKVLTEGTEKLRIDSNGKILNTAATNTVATLDLYGGNTTVSAVDEVNAQIRFRSKDDSVTNAEENVGGAIKSIVEYSNGAYVGLSFETYKQDRTPRLQEAVRIRHDGKVGIGTVSPNWPLTVQGSSGTIVSAIKNTGGNSTAYIESSNSNTAKLELFQAGVGGFTLEVGGTNALMIKDDGTERFRIDSSGDIGLGESNPNRTGYSSPVTSVGYNSTNGYSVLELLGNKTSNDTIANIVAYNVGGSSRVAAIAFERSGANNSGAIRFETYSSGSAGERLRIGPLGQIGIAGANYGTDGQVLTSKGSGAVVQWAAAPTPYGGALDGMIFGGVETTYTSGGTTYKVHTFTSSGFLRVTAAISMNFLIVGGGGGTAAAELSYGATGGGGAGGMVEGTGITIPAGKHTITVGSGGAASNAYNVAGSGGDSSFSYGGTTVTAKGGGGSPDYASAGTNGGSGSGGSEPNGSAGSSTQSSQNSGISNIQQFGNAGGAAAGYTSGAGGGGGAGGAGQSRSAGGAGGSGRANSITGSSVTYAVGGNGGATGYANGSAGTNGRGNGASGATSSHPSEGQGAAGGSGIVIVRYVFS